MYPTISLSQDDVEAYKDLNKIIEAQQIILDNLHYAFERKIQEKYGIDLDHENWVIDLGRGVLERATTEQGG